MTSHSNIDPELRILLQEVADDPKAKLFRTEIPRPERLVLTGAPHTGLRAAGLTNAEREILRVYREDVAKILRDAAEWKIQQDPLGAATSSRYADPYVERRFATSDSLLQSMRSRTDQVRRLKLVSHPPDVVDTGASLLCGTVATASQLAGLSLRLESHDAAWIHIARSLLLEDDARCAMSSLTGVVRRAQSLSLRSSALTYVAVAFSRAGRRLDAAAAYCAAIQANDLDVNSRLSWFAEACFSGDDDLVRRAAERVDPDLDWNSPGVQQWLVEFEQRREINTHLWPVLPSPLTRERLAATLGPTARRLIHGI